MTDPKERPLFQVHVFDAAVGHEIPIGPAMDQQDALLGLAESTNSSIALGKIHGWRDAHIKQVR